MNIRDNISIDNTGECMIYVSVSDMSCDCRLELKCGGVMFYSPLPPRQPCNYGTTFCLVRLAYGSTLQLRYTD